MVGGMTVIVMLAYTMRQDCGGIAAGEMRGERLRLRVSRVEHVERVEDFSRKERKGRKDLNHGGSE